MKVALEQVDGVSILPTGMAVGSTLGTGRGPRRFPFEVALALAGLSTGPLAAQTVKFDLDSGTPVARVFSAFPIEQTVDGITARFSSPAGAAYSIQNAASTGFHLSQFSGKFIYPNTSESAALVIQFSQLLTTISISYATVDYPDNAETPSLITLSVFDSAAPGAALGKVSEHGTYAGNTYPMGAITLSSTNQAFDRVVLEVPEQTGRIPAFLVDNIVVSPRVAVEPALSIRPGPTGGLVLAWPASAAGYVVQESDTVEGGPWSNSARPVSTVDQEFQVTIPPTARTPLLPPKTSLN